MSLIIILVGFELAKSSVGKIIAPEPVDSSVAVIVVLAFTAGIEGLQSIHDFRMVAGPTHTNVIFDAVLTPACPLDRDGVRDSVEAELRKIDPRYCVVINYDQAYV